MDKAEILAQIMFEEDEYREANGMELMYYTKEDFEAEKKERKKKEMRTEMTTLINKLIIANIPFELTTDCCGNENNQIWYPSYDKSVCDVICHKFSYGGTKGLLEIMGLTDNEDDVEGWLTADEVFSRIYIHYMNRD